MPKRCSHCNSFLNLTDSKGYPRYVCSKCENVVWLEERGAVQDELRLQVQELLAATKAGLERELAEQRRRERRDEPPERMPVKLCVPLAELLAVRRVAKPEDLSRLRGIAKGAD